MSIPKLERPTRLVLALPLAAIFAVALGSACSHGVLDSLPDGATAAGGDSDAATSATSATSGSAPPPDDAGSMPDAAPRSDAGPSALPGTWKSGASGVGVASGEFAAWRGSPTPIGGTWNDGDWDSSENQWTLSGEYADWQGDLDDTLGAFWDGSWAQAATGAYDDHWHKAVQSMAKARAGKGTLYIRLAHEMNGDWYSWQVNSSNVDDFKVAWVRFANIVREDFPQAKIVFGANNGTNGDVGIPEMWPGDAYVDVVGVDMYDMWPSIPDQETWNAQYMAMDNGNSPHGLGAWIAFTKEHGKPMSVPEWGLNWADDGSPGPQDNPFYIQKMNEFFRENAGDAAGQILYEIYYNIDDVKSQLHPVASNPDAAAEYEKLVWGK